jgi:phage-related protein
VIAEKRLPARFYRTIGGTEPVRDWLKGLDPADRRIVGADIKEIEFDWPVGMPLCRPLGHGLWELRSHISRGRIARVFFCIVRGEMNLLHGFIKKSQKTPHADLELAIRRKKEVER